MTIPNNRHARAPSHGRPGSVLGLSHFVGGPIPTVERRVSESTEIWARDLRSLFEHARDRFGDVSWESEEGGERIWAHKAIIYARAPKAFKQRYFLVRPFSRSPNPFTSPSVSPSPHLLPPFADGRSGSPAGSSSLVGTTRSGTNSSLSVASLNSDHTIRGQGVEGTMRLTHGDTPELFSAQLEWLYTGEGFGDVVEWIDEDTETGGSIRDSLGRRGDIHDRRDKLGQDLTYMWRSKLYVDVRIHLKPQMSPAEEEDDGEDESDSSTDSLSSTAVFTSHRFVLCSRSPYFASVLLNPAFKPQTTADIHLPTPPFTPAALHFCLGYMYAGHLDFSNRSFDLSTAFAIYRAAEYLQLESLVQEIEARIVQDFCHGLDVAKCKCRRCPLRAARIWRFAAAPDIGAVQLQDQARQYVISAWGQSWGREIGTMDEQDKTELVRDVCSTIKPKTVVGALRAMQAVRARMDNAMRTRGREATVWVDSLGVMVDQVDQHLRTILSTQFDQVAQSAELWTLLSGKGFDGDVLETLMGFVVASVSTAQSCVEAPRVYQALVSSILLRVDPMTQGPVLMPRSQARQEVDTAREGVLAHIRKRWMQIRDAGGFHDLEHWVLKEISDEIDVSLDDLVTQSAIPPFARARMAGSSGPNAGLPRTTSRVMSLSDAASVRSAATRTSVSSRPSTVRAEVATGPTTITRLEAPGLRRLRLSSSASTTSVSSARSARSVSGPATAPIPGGATARSPTAAAKGTRVSIGHRSREIASPTPSSSRPTRQISGPPKPLMTRATPRPAPAANATASSSASVRSVRTTKTTASAATTSAVPKPTSPSKIPAIKPVPANDKGKGRTESSPTPSTNTNRQKPPSSVPSGSSVFMGRPPPPPTGQKPDRKSSPTPSVSKGKQRAVPAASAAPTHVSRATPRTKSPTPSTASVRSRATTAMAASARLAKPADISARVRQTSTASQAPSLNKVPTATRPNPTPAARTAAANSVRSRAAAINAQHTGPERGSVKPRISEPPKSSPTAVPGARMRSPSVSSVASAASKRSVASRAPVPPRMPAPAGSSTVRARNPSTSTTKSQVPSANNQAGALPPHSASVPSSIESTGLPPPSVTSPRKMPTAATMPKRSGPPSLVAPKRPPPRIPSATQGFRSPSGSTDGASEAVTPRMDAVVIAPVIRREGSDVSDLPMNGSPPKQSYISHAVNIPARATRKTSQTSTLSTNSSFRPHPASAFDPPKREPKPVMLPPLEVPEGCTAWTGPGMALRQGVTCIVSLDKKRARFKAVIKYIGLLQDADGPWLGIETDDLDRFGVTTMPTGALDGIHYFHLSRPIHTPDANKLARQRKLDLIRQSLGKRASVFITNTGPPSIGLGIPGHPSTVNGGGSKRSISPFAAEHGSGILFEHPRALFVRPHEVVFVLGAE